MRGKTGCGHCRERSSGLIQPSSSIGLDSPMADLQAEPVVEAGLEGLPPGEQHELPPVDPVGVPAEQEAPDGDAERQQAIEQEIQRRIDAGLLQVVPAADAAAGAPPEGGAAPMEVDASGAAAALAAAAGANAADAVGAGVAGAAGAVVAGAAGAGAGVPFVAVAPPPLPHDPADLAVAEATLRHCEHVALEGQQLSPVRRCRRLKPVPMLKCAERAQRGRDCDGHRGCGRAAGRRRGRRHH